MKQLTRVLSGALALVLCLASGCSSSGDARPAAGPAHRFEIGPDEFLLDGRPFVIRSGEMHAARVPREAWQQRLRMIRALGCNTVCAYLFWNQHEPRKGEFDFAGAADVAEYCRLAQAEGLWVILRPGPYSCAEWDLGGFPSWLLAEPNLQLRSRDARYLAAVERYLKRVGAELAPLQVTRGGPILMVQVENEYGSYGQDKEYIGALRDMLVRAGFQVPLFTCDGPAQLVHGARDDLFSVVNFGSNPDAAFAALRKVRPSGPLMCGEYYPGWFDSWGKPHHRGEVDSALKDLESMLQKRQSFSLYMAHGGTSFGFSAGANSPPFSPQSTSYDYDAPISESGHATPKFHALRALFARHLNPGETLPPIPPAPPSTGFARVTLGEGVPLLADLGERRHFGDVLTMEQLGVPHGALLYRGKLPPGGPATLRLVDVHDIAYVYLDGQRIEVLDRRARQGAVKLGAREKEGVLDILVEALGRVNYGPDLHDRKGITQRVVLADERGERELGSWEVFGLPFDAQHLARLAYRPVPAPLGVPAFYRGRFELQAPADTHLDTRGWSKGFVWVNGRNLGRYWKIGPQQTLYVPGAWLRKGRNEVVVLDLDGETGSLALQGLAEPLLDQLGEDALARRALRRPGQELTLAGLVPVVTETFADGPAMQSAHFEPRKARYVALVAHSAQRDEAFTSLAELELIGLGGVALPRSNWRVLYADSEELASEDGSALNVLDGDPQTLWHTQWSASQPAHPHALVLDLGEEQALTGVRCLPRQANANGRIKRCEVFLSNTPFAGL